MSSQTAESSETRSSPYDELPDPVRQYYSEQEYLWLTDQQKALLIQTETEPEWT